MVVCLLQESCELQKCMFQVEDSMSVHAMYSSGLATNVSASRASNRGRTDTNSHVCVEVT